jgi:hypothetical protein
MPQRAAVATAPPVAAPQVPPQPPMNIPAGAEWTIYCYAVKGPGHVQGSLDAKAGLVRLTGQPDWYVIHGRDESKVYFGYFKSVRASGRGDDPVEVARAERAMKLVTEVKDVNGDTPFKSKAAFVSLVAPDPAAATDWNLSNVDRSLNPQDPKRAYWSLQVAAFRADPKRKEAAVQMVKDLRAQGVEAYYYHGEAVSSVCVGKWPAAALRAQNRTDEFKDQAKASPNSSLLVSGVPLDDLAKLDGAEYVEPKTVDGRQAVAVAPKMEVLDPTLEAARQKFPRHSVNYEEGKRMPDGKVVYNSSFLVVIPREPGNGLYDNDNAAVAARRTARGTGDGKYDRGGMVAPRERVLGADAGQGFPPRQ